MHIGEGLKVWPVSDGCILTVITSSSWRWFYLNLDNLIQVITVSGISKFLKIISRFSQLYLIGKGFNLYPCSWQLYPVPVGYISVLRVYILFCFLGVYFVPRGYISFLGGIFGWWRSYTQMWALEMLLHLKITLSSYLRTWWSWFCSWCCILRRFSLYWLMTNFSEELRRSRGCNTLYYTL